MAKYIYPAVFTEEENGFSVNFPDLDGAYTCGETLSEALAMAEDVLPLTLVDYEDCKQDIPAPSSVKDVSTDDNEFVSLVSCDTEKYRRLMKNQAVKKTLSIPEWLNEAAIAAGLNFSQVLQDALKEKIGVN
ncbi:type II toxin-antitoxin system HicB family antitoxin [Lachnoclostridium sp. Marseille-P6806]|uniref:type II toxin-antitoxin system HicB family antitoxin n=1 Tax=Lachnoclostridium sp. Marseille-P6806 TaxID=2364793 RepID=UPI001032653A|nr:type II toxin-antitoxin system HicB family antitoxin [Lachnoclostridium sp. Marseille-P6806]